MKTLPRRIDVPIHVPTDKSAPKSKAKNISLNSSRDGKPGMRFKNPLPESKVSIRI